MSAQPQRLDFEEEKKEVRVEPGFGHKILPGQKKSRLSLVSEQSKEEHPSKSSHSLQSNGKPSSGDSDNAI